MFRTAAAAFLVALVGASVFAAPAPSVAPAPTKAAPPGDTLEHVVKQQVAAALDTLQKDGNFDGATDQLTHVFDTVILSGSDKNLEAFRDSAFALLMVKQLATLPAAQRTDLLSYLRANDTLARTLVFLIYDDKEAPGAFAMLNRLRKKHAADLDTYANLAAAICVVHDKPFTRSINEVDTKSPDPVAIFEYYTANEKAMLFGVKNVPAELLMYVVDTTASIEDMTWALHKYAGDPAVGRHFFDIGYDYDYFKKGSKKKISGAGYTLPNILKFGGVCADQAYFAMEVGKAIGVPTTYTTASSADVGHAWVGFLQTKGDQLFWNFDVGRYEEYKGIRGDVIDPQLGQRIPDSYVSLLAELLGSPSHRAKVTDRQASVAVTEAAFRLANAALGVRTLEPLKLDVTLTDALRMPRPVTTEAALSLVETALNQTIANRAAWVLVEQLAAHNKLSLAQKTLWGSAVVNRCGDKYPDFALTILAPMIGTVDDPARQDAMWAGAFGKFQGRSDLAAEILTYRAELWESQKATAKAGGFYVDIVNRYCNAGPFVIPALAKAEQLLAGKPEKVLQLYQQSWGRIQRPEDASGPFRQQSNWFRVGTMYADKLAAAGDTRQAQAVYQKLGVDPPMGKQ